MCSSILEEYSTDNIVEHKNYVYIYILINDCKPAKLRQFPYIVHCIALESTQATDLCVLGIPRS